MLQNACVPEVMLIVSGYDPARGAYALSVKLA